ncbi:MAG: T9SS type A sorting domain-containing protein [Saprospiraceae bacterium]|nr:T9SS type A sorting domain-containing protein [Saprospiraceae bacterium]
MNHIKLIFIILLFSIKSFGQTEFMPIGSTTYTAYIAYGDEGSAVFNPLKDTLCNGEPCRKVKNTRKNKKTNAIFTEYVYFQQKSDSIFEYNEYNKKWFFLFKNHYNVGDSFDIKEVIANSAFTNTNVYVDSVVVANGIKRYACRIKCLPYSNISPLIFTHFNLYDKFIPDQNWHLYSICTRAYNDGYYYYPLCYTENAIDYHTPLYTGPNCDSITRTLNPIQLPENLDFTLSPNPANSFLSIKSGQKQSIRLNILNIQGQLILEKTIVAPDELNISEFPNGIYLVKAESEKGISKTQKLIVHH